MTEKMNSYQSMNSLLRLVIEFGPLVAFFAANAGYGIYVATGVFMVVSVFTLGLAYIRTRHIPTLPLVSGAIVLVFGGLTLYLQDEIFIKLKPTIVNLLFAVAIFGGLVGGKNYVRSLMGAMVPLSEEGWRILAMRWAWFFLTMAGINELVWRNFSTDIWVAFKVFGFLPLTIIFVLGQAPLIKRYTIPGDTP